MTSVKLLRAVRTDARFHTTWPISSELTGLKSSWLFFLGYYARESVPESQSEYRHVETSAGLSVGRAGPQSSLQLVSLCLCEAWHCWRAVGTEDWDWERADVSISARWSEWLLEIIEDYDAQFTITALCNYYVSMFLMYSVCNFMYTDGRW